MLFLEAAQQTMEYYLVIGYSDFLIELLYFKF